MSIKFNCSHCQKSLKVSQALAGKKARCPGCKQVITIPTLEPVVPAEVEDLAAAALADELKPAAPVEAEKKAAPIKFTCFYCDEEVEVDAELAGKQTPCPACRRIVKVPMPVQEGPRDWRTVTPRGPAAGLRRDEQAAAPEGSWGTATSASHVSRQALLEADAVPLADEEDEVSWPQRIVRGLIAAAVVVIVGTGVWAVLHVREQNLQKKALQQTLKFVPEGGGSALTNVEAAEIHRAIGEYYLREGKGKDPAKDARQQFKLAQARLRQETPSAKPTAEHDALAIDLALTYIDLFGPSEEADRGLRLPWGEAAKELRPILQGITAPEARQQALRQVSRKLVRKGQANLAETLAYMLSADADRPDMVAQVGLELVCNQQAEEAGGLATKALEAFDTAKPGQPPAALVALLAALHEEKKATTNLRAAPPAEGVKNPAPPIRLGYAEGWALLGNWPQAQSLAGAPGNPTDQWTTLVAVAAIATAEQKTAEARQLLEKALDALDKDPRGKTADPWQLLRLAQLGYRAGLGERLEPIVAALPDSSFRNRARLEKLRAQLAGSTQEETEKLNEEAQAETKYPLALELLARHNARYGNPKAVLEAVAAWEPEPLRAFGYAGVMLGVQDSGKGEP